ncbi:alpha/beta fold hydrolase [Stakelama tenebrarum]|uniref:Alpha/beta hydrolase n=1 Tax=Stakelama tenebrarum TaxID=2711215 RepID=A0A6G6Y220_9SPHN|nr:alpha/beta hydrolase [Sphingosinithalassobacter tenebrarum]QIG78857.1 alpha/beta hydrolase [Sphingosinithalassobacter tenebrarum]
MTLPIMTALPGERRGYVDGPDGQLHYRSMGEGPAVVLVHQAPWSSIQFRHALPLIARAGFRAIAIDLPAHGMSDPPTTPSIEAYAQATAALIEALDVAPAIVLGHRGGGLAAGKLAADRPELVRALILDNAPFMSAEDRAARIGRFPDNQEIAPDGRHISDRWEWVKRVGDKDWSDETVHIGVVSYFLHGPWKEHGHSVIPLFDFEAEVPRISAPTLIIGSRTDAVFPSAARLREARPDWNYAELPGGPGMVLDRITEWWVPVATFLNSVAKTAQSETIDGNTA